MLVVQSYDRTELSLLSSAGHSQRTTRTRAAQKGLNMNWSKASAIAEILSSIAIVITIGYLALEIEQNAEATRAEVRQEMLASDQQFLELFIVNPQLALMWYRENLTEEEKTSLGYLLITHLRMRENNWLQYRSGVLDEASWRSYRRSLIPVLSAPQTRKWWKGFGVERIFDSGFIAEVNELIADQPISERAPNVSAFD